MVLRPQSSGFTRSVLLDDIWLTGVRHMAGRQGRFFGLVRVVFECTLVEYLLPQKSIVFNANSNWIEFNLESLQNALSKLKFNPIRPGGGGAQRPGWPNSQLPIRNLLSYDAQTWWLLVFILETPFGHISAKLVNQGGCCCSFLIETSQKFWKWKIFPMLENCWNWLGGSILGREERFWT